MKCGKHLELRDVIESHRESLFIPYSTIHIDDMICKKKISEPLISEDLDYISKLSQNQCLYFDQEKTLHIENICPHKVREDCELNNFDISAFSFDKMLDALGSVDNPIRKRVEKLRQIPIGATLPETPYLKGLPQNPSFTQLFDSIIQYFASLGKTNEYANLRALFQSSIGINRDASFNWKHPIDKLNMHLIKSSSVNMNYETFREQIGVNRKGSSWFDDIVFTYQHLDMAGYKEDQIKITDKKSNTFTNVINDAFHAALASSCHVFISNDTRCSEKSIAVYEHLGIPTHVLKPAEAAERINKLVFSPPDYSALLNWVVQQIKESPCTLTELESIGRVKNYNCTSYLLGFFNRIYLPQPSEKPGFTIVLSSEKPSNGRFTLFMDIKHVLACFDKYFGSQVAVSFDEERWCKIAEAKEPLLIQRWINNCDGLTHDLVNSNGYFQYYICSV
jgi:hypothetical protein